MFRNVQLKVKHAIGQDPWLSFPTLPAVYFAGNRTAEDIEFGVWQSVKDSRAPDVIATYLTRYPDGQFAPLARALIAHFEQQVSAEQARLVEKQRLAEFERLAEEQRTREQDVTARRQEAEEKANVQAAQELERQRVADALAYAEKMRRALEEVRVAREMDKAAVEERLAAEKAVEEATKAAQTTAAGKPSGASANDRIVIAALPKLPTAENFDGQWTIVRVAQSCNRQHVTFTLTINGATARGKTSVVGPGGDIYVSGGVSSAGAISFSHAGADGGRVSYSGVLRGKSGSGAFNYPGTTCQGTFTAQRK
jgi:hypothetical protein